VGLLGPDDALSTLQDARASFFPPTARRALNTTSAHGAEPVRRPLFNKRSLSPILRERRPGREQPLD
jgi:hypothetical protein